jgi:hypothetical protein
MTLKERIYADLKQAYLQNANSSNFRSELKYCGAIFVLWK